MNLQKRILVTVNSQIVWNSSQFNKDYSIQFSIESRIGKTLSQQEGLYQMTHMG